MKRHKIDPHEALIKTMTREQLEELLEKCIKWDGLVPRPVYDFPERAVEIIWKAHKNNGATKAQIRAIRRLMELDGWEPENEDSLIEEALGYSEIEYCVSKKKSRLRHLNKHEAAAVIEHLARFVLTGLPISTSA